MDVTTVQFLLQATIVYITIFTLHCFRRRITIAPLYVVLGGLGWVMYWITDAGVRITLFGTPVLVGSTLYFSAIIVTVFIIYLFDEPEVTRRTVSIVIGIAIIVPITSVILRYHVFLDPGTNLWQVPAPHFRSTAASILALIADVVFLIFGWELVSKRAKRLPLWIKLFMMLLAVMWLDVLLYGTGSFLGTAHFRNHIFGTGMVRFWTVVVIFPFMWFYIAWQKSRYPLLDGENTAKEVFSRIAFMEHELTRTRLTLEEQIRTEQKLKESERLKGAVIDHSPIGISVRDKTGTLLSANPAWQKIWNISDDDMPKRFEPKEKLTFSENDGYLGEHIRAIKRVYETGGSYFIPEVRPLVQTPGKAQWISQFFYAIHDDAGQVDKIVILTEDITERKIAEASRVKLENQYRLLFNSLQDAILVADTDRKIVDCNLAFTDLYGYTLDEIRGWPTADIYMNQNEFKTMGEALRQHMDELGYFTTIHYKKKSGESFTGETRVQYLRDLHGEINGFLALIRDVTEREKLLAELRRSEGHNRDLIEHSQDLICTHTLDGRLLTVNPAALHQLGYSTSQVLNSNLKDVIVPEGRPGWDTYIKTIVADEHAEGLMEVQSKTGERYIWEYRNTLRTDGVPEPIVRGVARDITKQKKMERSLRESEERFRTLYENATIGLYRSTPAGQILMANPTLVRMLGYDSFEELSNKNLEVEGFSSSSPRLEFIRKIELNGSVSGLESAWIRKDGKTIYVRESAQAVRDGNGKTRFYDGSIEDITERKRLETQLQQSQKMESIGRLAGGVAHDYNNMLSVIIGHAELALERLDQKQAAESDLNAILKAAQRSAEITRQLLTFARRQTINPQPLELNQVIKEMLQMLNRLIGEDIDLVWLPGEEAWPVKMDPTQVDQILANLCVNARDAIIGVGKITIETSNVVLDEPFCKEHPGATPGDYVQLSVSDDGAGMDHTTAAQIFEPFFTTKKMGKGTGLGLATVYGIVKQNDGFVNVYSEPDLGTTFKIYFPRYSGQTEPIKIVEESNIEPGKGERILLVEDESAVRNLGEMMLKSLGYQVISAGGPMDALKLMELETEKIELLITDVVMPEMNGRDFASRIQTRFPDIKIIFMSGYTANVIAHRGVLGEGVNFLQKPFTVNALASKLRSVLAH